MPLKSLSEVLSASDTLPEWICDPYVARRGITFLHGKTSIGKSPVTWELARCAAQGLDFLGHPTTQSRVLYLEADSAEALIRPRLRLLPDPKLGDWRFEFLSGTSLDLCNEGHTCHRLFAKHHHDFHPDLVVWNTLRQFYKGSNIDSDVITRVYNAMYRAFPDAGHLVVAHDRKQSVTDTPTPDEEAFSGSAAWRDLATVALHLVPRGTKGGTSLSLDHTKSQVSELTEPLKFLLDPNGTHLHVTPHPLYDRLRAFMDARGTDKLDETTVALAEVALSVSRRTLFRIWGSSK